MLAGAGAGRAVLAAFVGMGMLRAVGMEVGVIVGMLVGMGVRMVMAAGHVFGIDMYRIASLIFLRNL